MKVDEPPKSHGVTWKSIVITLVLIPFNFYWIIAGEVGLVGYALNTYAVPFYNVVFVVFAFTLLNIATRRRLFTDAELLTIYILLSTACAFPLYYADDDSRHDHRTRLLVRNARK